jgi:predicted GH43/DUF377 family glycosyl hydrolase
MNPSFVWNREKENPIITPVKGSWMEDQTANPDLLLVGNRYHLYFRGQQGGHDRIGVATVDQEKFDGKTWDIHPEPVIDVGEQGEWDETHVLDPASVIAEDQIFLYYSAVCPRCDRSICLATSDDGLHFRKYDKNPLLMGGGPEIVYHQGVFYLFFWKAKEEGGYDIHLAVSINGYHFEETTQNPILRTAPKGRWDSHSVETPRVFKEGNLFYMLYCGSDQYDDYPEHAGLAVSTDLVNWQKYSENPIFSRGEAGEWDEGAIWYPTVEKIQGMYYLLYEGYGGGEAREKPYGSYLKGGKSQIGLATLNADHFFLSSDTQINI